MEGIELKQVDLLPMLDTHSISPDTPETNRLKERLAGTRKFIALLAPDWQKKSLEEIAGSMNRLLDAHEQKKAAEDPCS